jgi:putative hydrolase of the HAD superfamily
VKNELFCMRLLPDFLLLDLDDTILNFTATGDQCWESLCISFAPQLCQINPDQLLSAINQNREWFWSDMERHRNGRLDLQSARRQIVAMAFSQLRIDNHKISEELADSFTTMREELVQPFPGSMETLKILQDHDIRMGLITNGDAGFQRSKIRRFHLEQYFDFVLIESEFGVGKPDQRVFKYALEQLGAFPTQAWMIGDDLRFDICPARELGMNTVWVNHTKTGLPANSLVLPTWTIHSLVELLEKL